MYYLETLWRSLNEVINKEKWGEIYQVIEIFLQRRLFAKWSI